MREVEKSGGQRRIGPTAGVLRRNVVNVGKVKDMEVNGINCIKSKANGITALNKTA